jgi:hypothetical protein
MSTFGAIGIQDYTIPTTGEYDITVDGAQGGSTFQNSSAAGVPGGAGAAVGGDVYLQGGDVLQIVVGGEGQPGAYAAGGGGGSYVIEIFNGSTSVDTILAIAGGGGGASSKGVGGEGQSGPTGAHGGGGGGAGGVDGAAGSGGMLGGGGGGGFTGGAGAGLGANGGAGHVVTGGTFGGGAPSGVSAGTGGFGGGGGGGYTGGGGGGGYGGGGGGGHANGAGGGGGGSFFNGTATTDATGGAAAENSANSGNGQVTISLVCFVSGALVRTKRGEIAVEDLAVGDLAVTASGEARPIQWLGCRRIERPLRDQWPVRVMAGAFGDGLPARDLLLSPGHAVCVDVMGEVFVPVGKLTNGATIAQVEVPDVTYWHVELETHDVLLAEGLPCESYMDAGNRAFFGREYGRLAAVDPDRVAESLIRYARPFVDQGPIVEAIRQRLTARAKTLGEVAEHCRAA